MFPFRKGKNSRKGERTEDLPEENDGLPDSNRPSGLCPRCGKQSSFEIAGSLPATFSGMVTRLNDSVVHDLIDRVTSLCCRHCNQCVIVIEEQWVGDIPATKGRRSGYVSYRGFHWWPLPDTKLPESIPTEIAEAFAEAVKAIHAKCPRAAAVMARRTLEAITVDKGETKGTLSDRLKELGNKGILYPTLSDWAKEVRLIGNSGAHFDPITKVSIQDAQQLISFIRELLKYLYELPADLAKRRTSSP
jgi:hypothetical protein